MKLFFLLSISISLFAITTGVLLNSKTNLPVVGAYIYSKTYTTRSSDKGVFTVPNDDFKTLHVKAYGYWPFTINTKNINQTYYLKPIHIKALYLSFWSESLHGKRLQNILQLAKSKKINTLVVDIKNTSGYISYDTNCTSARISGAYKYQMIKNIKHFLKVLKQYHIYTIARIDVFKDSLRALKFPSLALHVKGSNVIKKWLSPYNKQNYKYILSIAKNAASYGFDEINFDYIRFPAHLRATKNDTNTDKTIAIADFLKQAKKVLRPYGVFISIDVFGNALWANANSNIGQNIKLMLKYTDYLDPMLYPSGFSSGWFGFTYPALHPYAVISKSLNQASKTVTPIRLHPWLQAFRDYSAKRKIYGSYAIQAQINASNNAHTGGWILWNPASEYNLSNIVTDAL